MNECHCPKTWISFFKAIGDHHRQSILELIKTHQSINASDIVKHNKLSQPTISHHLMILKRAGLIQEKKKGREVYYSINDKKISSCCLGFMHKLVK